MKISREDVLHVANLARLELDDASVHRYAEQIAGILDYVALLNRVDTTGIAPTSHAIALTNAFREDVPEVVMERDMALANAPDKEDGQFVVPKVVG